jgi:hypothetical protein
MSLRRRATRPTRRSGVAAGVNEPRDIDLAELAC